MHIKPISKIPTVSSLPVIGSLYHYLPVIGEYNFEKLRISGLKKYQKYGPIVREQIVPGSNIIWLFDPNDIETLFRTEGKYPSRDSHLALQHYRLNRPNVYKTGGLLPTNGLEWYRLRKNFQNGLSGLNAVKKFLVGVNGIIDEWLNQRVDSIRNQSNIDYLPELCRLYLELTGYETLDIRMYSFINDQLNSNSQSSKLIQSAFISNTTVFKLDNSLRLWKYFDTPLYRKFVNSQKFMEKVALNILQKKMDNFNSENSKNTLIEQYLKNPNVDFKDIVGIISDFLLAGIDTSTYTTSFLLYYISKSPSVQMALYDEIIKLLPTIDTPITTDILNNSIYAKAVLKEVFRLQPISVGIGRKLTDDTIIRGYNIPKDTIIVTQNQVVCRLNEYFQQPNEFKPERWIRNHLLYEKKHPFLVLPFGYGQRSCIARHAAEQHILVLLLKIIRRYKLEWTGGLLDSKSLLINIPDGPILVKFHRRD